MTQGSFTKFDIRGQGYWVDEKESERNIVRSQSELVAALRGQTHTCRPLTIEAIIFGIENLSPELLDTWSAKQRG